MGELNRQLDPGHPLVGQSWGAADCAVQAYLAYLPIFFPDIDLSPYPVIQTMIERVRERPAYQIAMGAR
jgi:glutathione S-transferase